MSLDCLRVESCWVRVVVSHPCDKNKYVAKVGHPGFMGERRKGWVRFVVSHPSDKNKDVARVGHPGFVVERTKGWVGFVGFGVVVSHPCAQMHGARMGHGALMAKTHGEGRFLLSQVRRKNKNAPNLGHPACEARAGHLRLRRETQRRPGVKP